jgi:CNT family concentrative nucleoside transporter
MCNVSVLFTNPFVLRIVGILSVFFISVALSENRKKINWISSVSLFSSIIILAYLLVSFEMGIMIIDYAVKLFEFLYVCALEGVTFIFGDLAHIEKVGFVFAIRVLPMIIFFSALTGVLYHFRVIQMVVFFIGRIVRPFYNTTGPETVCAIANSFLSQTEAPLLIKKYLKGMTESEIFVVMVSGMATISSSLFAVYSAMGVSIKHLLIASILSIPSSLFISKIIVPATGEEREDSSYDFMSSDESSDFFLVLSEWVSNGLMIALNVGSMLIAIISLLFLINICITSLTSYFSLCNCSFDQLLSFFMWPFSYCLGIPLCEVSTVSSLLASKVVINEMIAYISMTSKAAILRENTLVYLTYALCGFSNFSCIGIQLGFFGGLEPGLKKIVNKLGFKAVFAAMFVNLINAYIIGFFIY